MKPTAVPGRTEFTEDDKKMFNLALGWWGHFDHTENPRPIDRFQLNLDNGRKWVATQFPFETMIIENNERIVYYGPQLELRSDALKESIEKLVWTSCEPDKTGNKITQTTYDNDPVNNDKLIFVRTIEFTEGLVCITVESFWEFDSQDFPNKQAEILYYEYPMF